MAEIVVEVLKGDIAMVDVKERPKARTEQMRGEQADRMAHAIRKIGIVGAGQMGNGIAHVCALSGFNVLLNDIVPDRITAGTGDHQRQSGASGQPAAHQRRGARRPRSSASRRPTRSTSSATAIW